VDAERIFVRYFLPLYPPDAREDLARARVTDANPGRNPSIVAHLDEAATRFVHKGRALFGEDLRLDGSDASVHRLSSALTMARRTVWTSDGKEGTADSALFNAVVHGSAYVGRCIVDNHGGNWECRRPLWESLVRLRSPAGEGDLAIFHWWLKSLSDAALAAEMGATLADRYRTHVETPCTPVDALPVLVKEARALPRLLRPTYDRLHQYLRAHVPEVRDLGEDFPSAERFAAFDFRWMEFLLPGQGRLLLMAGASPAGLHVFWLGARGFEKSAFFACDAFPDPVVRLDGDRVVAIVSADGKPSVHDMMWWGP
jgi:hypothetical protein